MINIDNINFTLPNGMQILRDISFTVKPGDFIVLLGSNGSGKSSLIKVLNRSYRPNSGNINIDNKNIQSITHKTFAEQVITLTQFVKDSLFLDLTIAENALLIEESYENKKIPPKAKFKQQLAEYLKNFNQKLAGNVNRSLQNLSGGEQQILAFALYLRHQPKLLLLDEHTSALDPKTGQQIMQFTADIVREKQLTCIMTTHNLEFAIEYGNRVIALNQGKIAFEANSEEKTKLDRETLMKSCY